MRLFFFSDADKSVPSIQPIFITLDPDRDTVEYMRKYCKGELLSSCKLRAYHRFEHIQIMQLATKQDVKLSILVDPFL